MSRLFIRDAGPPGAPAIIFLHGVGNTGQMWRGHIDALAGFHCVAPDLPGHGRSSSISWSSRPQTADQIIGLIERLPRARAHVVGLSLGGSLAFEMLARRPDVLDHVIIDGCAAVGSHIAMVMKVGVALAAPFIRQPAAGRLVAKAVGVTDPAGVADLVEQLGQVDSVSFRRAFWQAQDVRISKALVRATCPTLFVAGEHELVYVRGSNRLIAELMPRAESRFMPGGSRLARVGPRRSHCDGPGMAERRTAPCGAAARDGPEAPA